MSVLSISRTPHQSEFGRAFKSGIDLDNRPEKLDSNTTSSTLRKTYPKIPADCYRKVLSYTPSDLSLKRDGLRVATHWGRAFTVAICWIPAGCFNVAALNHRPMPAVIGRIWIESSAFGVRARSRRTFKAACRNTGRLEPICHKEWSQFSQAVSVPV